MTIDIHLCCRHHHWCRYHSSQMSLPVWSCVCCTLSAISSLLVPLLFHLSSLHTSHLACHLMCSSLLFTDINFCHKCYSYDKQPTGASIIQYRKYGTLRDLHIPWLDPIRIIQVIALVTKECIFQQHLYTHVEMCLSAFFAFLSFQLPVMRSLLSDNRQYATECKVIIASNTINSCFKLNLTNWLQIPNISRNMEDL